MRSPPLQLNLFPRHRRRKVARRPEVARNQVQSLVPRIRLLVEANLPVRIRDAHRRQQRREKLPRRRIVAPRHRLLRIVDLAVDNQPVARLHALRHVTNLRQRIERPHRISREDKQARRLRRIGGVNQVYRARNIRLDPGGVDIFVVRPGAGHFQHRLARIHRKILTGCPGILQRAHQQAVARAVTRSEADHRHPPAEMFDNLRSRRRDRLPRLPQAAIQFRMLAQRRPFRRRTREPEEKLLGQIASFDCLREFLGDIRFGEDDFNFHIWDSNLYYRFRNP